MNKQPQQYIIKVEGTVPVTLEYRIYAKSEEEAFENFQYNRGYRSVMVGQPKYDMARLIKKKISIKDVLKNIIVFVKNL